VVEDVRPGQQTVCVQAAAARGPPGATWTCCSPQRWQDWLVRWVGVVIQSSPATSSSTVGAQHSRRGQGALLVVERRILAGNFGSGGLTVKAESCHSDHLLM
jgi:hypothetical protein